MQNLSVYIRVFKVQFKVHPSREFNEQFEELSRQFGLHDVLNTFNLHLTQRIHDLQEKETDTEEEYNDDLREIDNLEYLQEQLVLVLNELTKLGYAK